MNTDFSRIITLLRKERGISQKQAAAHLQVSQALLSHYEKGIRECGLEFVVRAADFYNVSCDYLLGRSPERNGAKIVVDELPDENDLPKNNVIKGKSNILPVLNKKLIINSLNILFDQLSLASNKALTNEVSNFLSIAVYRMFRVIYSINPKNKQELFTVSQNMSVAKSAGKMLDCEASASMIALNQAGKGIEKIKNPENCEISNEILSEKYPAYASSLLNLIQNSENKIK